MPSSVGGKSKISIHALREEGDQQRIDDLSDKLDISIHALREEGDSVAGANYRRTRRFLSTPSARRATVWKDGKGLVPWEFLSTPSARRATSMA